MIAMAELKLAPTSTIASTACTANRSNASQSTAGGTSRVLFLGPDFISQAGGYSTCTFNLQGPLFKGGNANYKWFIMV